MHFAGAAGFPGEKSITGGDGMTIFQEGNKGPEVARIQQALTTAGFPTDGADGDFGPKTTAAVTLFQQSKGLSADGMVGQETWNALFQEDAAASALDGASLDFKCLALTGSFETTKAPPACFSGLAGDFDGQGMSFGALQWNFGQGTLQPILKEMIDNHPDVTKACFNECYQQLCDVMGDDNASIMSFARSIQDPGSHSVSGQWGKSFRALGLTAECQAIQVKSAASYYQRSVALCTEYSLLSQRGRALMFDISVQNGSISQAVKEQILAGFDTLSPSLSPTEAEVEKMRIVANRRAEAANPKFIEDVRNRKLCIANGAGKVHGVTYDLEKDYGLTLSAA
jgi:hypothetical protein